MSTLKRSFFGLAAALLVAGCATGYETARERAYIEDAISYIEVSNHNWADMNVYLVVNGTKRRLGTVMSMTTDRFELPSYVTAVSGRVQLLADPIGSRETYLSPPIDIHEGQQVEWRLENAIQLSSLMLR